MSTQFLKEGLGWGILLWFIGYVLGMVLFFVVPIHLIGWFITPIGIIITWVVLVKKIQPNSYSYFMLLALVWTSLAIILDYIFIVQLLRPVDGYYKPDVYLYYIITFLLPALVGTTKKA